MRVLRVWASCWNIYQLKLTNVPSFLGLSIFHRFSTVLGRVWGGFGEGLGRVLGGVWTPLGVSWGIFKPLFLRLCCQEGPRGSKRRPRGLLGSIWEGFGGVLGRVWEAKLVKKLRFLVFFWICFSRRSFWSIFSIFDNFDVGIVKNTFFSMGVVDAFGGVWVENKMP